MDFVADQLFDGRKIRALTIRAARAVDNYSRQCVAIHVGQSLKGDDVVAVMNQLKQGRLCGDTFGYARADSSR
jgi:putative transposase